MSWYRSNSEEILQKFEYQYFKIPHRECEERSFLIATTDLLNKILRFSEVFSEVKAYYKIGKSRKVNINLERIVRYLTCKDRSSKWFILPRIFIWLLLSTKTYSFCSRLHSIMKISPPLLPLIDVYFYCTVSYQVLN